VSKHYPIRINGCKRSMARTSSRRFQAIFRCALNCHTHTFERGIQASGVVATKVIPQIGIWTDAVMYMQGRKLAPMRTTTTIPLHKRMEQRNRINAAGQRNRHMLTR
jgi:hypothetical protein